MINKNKKKKVQKVYVVFNEYEYEGCSYPLAAFTTKKRAEEAGADDYVELILNKPIEK